MKDRKVVFYDRSTLFPTSAAPLTITLKQFMHASVVIVRIIIKGNLLGTVVQKPITALFNNMRTLSAPRCCSTLIFSKTLN